MMSRSILVIALFPLCFVSTSQAAGNNSRSLEDLLRSITARQVYKTTDEPAATVDAVGAERARSEQAQRAPNPVPSAAKAIPVRREVVRDEIAEVVDAVQRERSTNLTMAQVNAAVGSAPTRTAASSRANTSPDAGIRDVVSILNPDRHSAQSKHQPIVDLDGESVAPLNTKKAPQAGASFAAVIPERTKPQAGVYTYGPVRGGIPLSEIATNLLPSANVSVAQMMWALYQKNKQSFANGDITRLKPNSTLNVPHLDEALAISRTAAEAALARMRTVPDRTASAKLNTAL